MLLQGVPPYKLAYNMNWLAGTYIAYRGVDGRLPANDRGNSNGTALGQCCATILLVYRLTRVLFDPFSAGMAAIAYSILSLSQTLLGMAAHATHFVAFFAVLGAHFLWRHVQSGKLMTAAASGLMLGLAFLMKQQGVFMMVFGAVVLVWLGLALASYPRRKLPLTFVAYSAAAVLPNVLTCLWLWRAGVWDKFWFWTVTYASKYVGNVSLRDGLRAFWFSSMHIASMNWPQLLLGLVGVAGVIVLGRRTPGVRVFMFSFAAFSFLCVCPGFYFREHYFIVVLPATAMFEGVGCRLIWDLAAGYWSSVSAAVSPVEQPAAERAETQKRQGNSKAKPQKAPIQPTASRGVDPLEALAARVMAAVIVAACLAAIAVAVSNT